MSWDADGRNAMVVMPMSLSGEERTNPIKTHVAEAGSAVERVGFAPAEVVRGAKGIRRLAGWVARGEPLILGCLLMLWLFGPGEAAAAGLLLLPVIWCCRRVAEGYLLVRTPFDWPVAGMLAMVPVSLVATFSLATEPNWKNVSGIVLSVASFYALVQWSARAGDLRLATAIYIVAGLVFAIVALMGTDWPGKFSILNRIAELMPRLTAHLSRSETGFDPNQIGGALLWVVPLQMALLSRSTASRLAPRQVRTGSGQVPGYLLLVQLGALILTAGTLLLTQSRGAALGLGVGIALLLWLYTSWRIRLLLGSGVILTIVALLLLGPEKISDSIYNANGTGLYLPNIYHSAEARFRIWGTSLHVISDHPLTGIGMNSFRQVIPTYYPGELANTQLPHAHDQLLQAALDLGLPGLVAYIALWSAAVTLLVRTWRASDNPETRIVTAGLGASLLAYAVFGITDVVVLGDKPGLIFWGLLALVAIAWRAILPASTAHTTVKTVKVNNPLLSLVRRR